VPIPTLADFYRTAFSPYALSGVQLDLAISKKNRNSALSNGRIIYQRFSPLEQHGCTAGGATNVIATLLAGAEASSDSQDPSALSDYKRECQRGAQQETLIEGGTRTLSTKYSLD